MADSSSRIAVFKCEDGHTYFVEDEGSVPQQFLHADRCTTLKDMPQSSELVVLPVSAEAIHIWKEAVGSSQIFETWGSQRAYDILKVAEVCKNQLAIITPKPRNSFDPAHSLASTVHCTL